MDKKLLLEQNKTYSIGRSDECSIVLPDSVVSRYHAEITVKNNKVIIQDLNSKNGVKVNDVHIKNEEIYHNDKIRIGSFHFIFKCFEDNTESGEYDRTLSDTLILENKLSKVLHEIRDKDTIEKVLDLKRFIDVAKNKIHEAANTDQLTGLENRRSFNEKLEKECERAKRYRHSLFLIITDIDHFKKVNDTYGHQRGDEVLAFVAKILRDNTRINDIVARYGGEELAVILPELDSENALRVADKIRNKVESLSKEVLQLPITISVGIACYLPESDCSSTIIEKADKALYHAKHQGRNKAYLYNNR